MNTLIVHSDKDFNRLLEKSIEYEQVKKELRETKAREESLRIMLAQACQEMESVFDVTGELASVEIATQYTVWARYLEINYGREHYGRVGMVQDWIENQ